MLVTRSQKYAKSAYENVRQVPEDQKTKYGSMVHKLPILIRTAGLAQTLSFVEAKDSNKILIKNLEDTLGISELAIRSREAELSEYMRLTRDVLAVLVWYKRFVLSELGIDVAGNDQ